MSDQFFAKRSRFVRSHLVVCRPRGTLEQCQIRGLSSTSFRKTYWKLGGRAAGVGLPRAGAPTISTPPSRKF